MHVFPDPCFVSPSNHPAHSTHAALPCAALPCSAPASPPSSPWPVLSPSPSPSRSRSRSPGGEGDLRACYTAMAVAHMLGLDADKQQLAARSGLAGYVRACQVRVCLGRRSGLRCTGSQDFRAGMKRRGHGRGGGGAGRNAGSGSWKVGGMGCGCMRARALALAARGTGQCRSGGAGGDDSS